MLAQVAAVPPETAEILSERLREIRDDLAAAARALAGEPEGIAPMARGGAVVTNMEARERARIAFTRILHTPRAINSFLRLVENARTQLEQRVARNLRRSGRRLLFGTRVLKAQLNALRHGTFDRQARRLRRH